MVAQRTLTPYVRVQILHPLPDAEVKDLGVFCYTKETERLKEMR